MITLADLLDLKLLNSMLEQGFVRAQQHPDLPLTILNYSEKAAYDSVWNDVTLQCRGLIYAESGQVLARPFRKFFNLGQIGAPELDLEEPAIVSDKLDGSLGILYPTGRTHRDAYAVATRGSFTSDQALHATEVWKERYARKLMPRHDWTYLVEIVYPENRIVVDYAGRDDLILLGVLETATGRPVAMTYWPGPCAETLAYASLAEALAAPERPNCEGLVVYFPATDERLKIKQDDYVALHRILTGTNARNVWEVAAVKACALYIREPQHWGSFLGIDAARAEECLALGDTWLAEVPDEFHEWVRETTAEARETAEALRNEALELYDQAIKLKDRRERYELVKEHRLAKEILRLAATDNGAAADVALQQLWLRCWREATPAPTAPFARSEAVA